MSFLKRVKELLDATDIDCDIVEGTRHMKVFVGKKLTAIYPKDAADENSRAAKNVLSQIKRAIKKEKESYVVHCP